MAEDPHADALAVAWLLALARDRRSYRLEMRSDDVAIIVSIGDTRYVPKGGKWLSPLEERLMAAIPPHGWITAMELAEAVGERYCDGIKRLLSNLVDRGLLESAVGRGYRLSQGAANLKGG